LASNELNATATCQCVHVKTDNYEEREGTHTQLGST